MRGTTARLPYKLTLSTLFQSPCPVRGTTSRRRRSARCSEHFNPRAPCGARLASMPFFVSSSRAFQSPCPVRGTTGSDPLSSHNIKLFQSPCPVRGTTHPYTHGPVSCHISIPVPRAGHDDEEVEKKRDDYIISIPVPRAGHDFADRGRFSHGCAFQSPCPVRGTTGRIEYQQGQISIHFNPRAPCGARQACGIFLECVVHNFNPRAPCGARRHAAKWWLGIDDISIPVPRAGHDRRFRDLRRQEIISIPVPRAGHDMVFKNKQRAVAHFNPRAPCGARHDTT